MASPDPESRGSGRGAAAETLGVAALLVALWEVVVRLLDVPRYLVPPPSDVARALVLGLATSPTARDGYYLHIMVTLVQALGGFVVGSVLGLLLAILLSQSRTLEALFLPYVVAFQSLPKIAFAPIMILWLGVGMESKILVAATLTFFPVLVNGLAGLRNVDRERIELVRGLGATRLQIFRSVLFPSALPLIFAGLDIALVYSLIGAIVAEFLGSTTGLGMMLLQMQFVTDTAGMFSIFILLSLAGAAMTGLLRLVRRRVLFWTPSERVTIGA
jgi:NitT/TauT family transport system permease protein